MITIILTVVMLITNFSICMYAINEGLTYNLVGVDHIRQLWLMLLFVASMFNLIPWMVLLVLAFGAKA